MTDSDRPTPDQAEPQDATTRARATGERALVLGGGGSTGNAWLIGVIAGLFDAGLDLTEADLVIGTSAGSTTAAQILQRRSTSYADAAAGSKRSSRMAAPSTCSAPMRWIRRCVRPLLGLVTTKAEPLPSSSANSGADAPEMQPDEVVSGTGRG